MNLPELNYQKILNTKNTIQSYTQILSHIKSTFTPHQKNAEEHALAIYAKGFTTTPIPIRLADRVEALDLNINLQEHKLKIFFGKQRLSVDLENQSISRFAEEVESLLNKVGVKYHLPENKFTNKEAAIYDTKIAADIWEALRHIYFSFQEFISGILLETSSTNFWPHHFDLACLLFSGEIIEGKDPNDWSNSHEQMNFGFLFGDDSISEPYFYITAYPFNELLLEKELPSKAYWYKEGWNGAILNYSDFIQAENPQNFLINFFAEVKNMNFNH